MKAGLAGAIPRPAPSSAQRENSFFGAKAIGGSIFGGAILSFIDMALFAGGRCAGMGEGHYVTLDCATHFIARGETNVPMDAVVRLVGETKGGLVFLSGHCEQGDRTTHSFTGTLKRVRARVADEAK
jgi:acyl-coenzyme A thioesterase PaaI-like protein